MPNDERVVSEQVMGSSNPVARFGRKLSDSVSGIFFGIVLIIGGFGLVWFGERQQDYSKDVSALPLTTAVASAQAGMVKVQGVPVVAVPFTAPRVNVPVIYFEYRRQEFKKVKETRSETRTIQRDGQDVQQTVEKDVYVDKWVDVSTDKKWAPFTVGGAKIDGANASLAYIDLKKLYEQETPTTEGGEVQKIRDIITGIPSNSTLVVVGESASGVISGGAPFIISDKSPEALVAAMQSGESRVYWGFKIAAWLLMTVGFVMLFGPLTTFLNILPGLGKFVSGILFVIFGVVSAIIVALGTVVIRYWWAVALVLVAAVVFAVAKGRGKGGAAA